MAVLLLLTLALILLITFAGFWVNILIVKGVTDMVGYAAAGEIAMSAAILTIGEIIAGTIHYKGRGYVSKVLRAK